jgi:transposase-like protein
MSGAAAQPSKREVAAAYRRLGSIPALAASYGVAFETARRWLIDAGIERQPKGRPSSNAQRLDNGELERRYRDGQSIASLGRRFGVSPATVRSRLLDAGVELRPRPGWKY